MSGKLFHIAYMKDIIFVYQCRKMFFFAYVRRGAQKGEEAKHFFSMGGDYRVPLGAPPHVSFIYSPVFPFPLKRKLLQPQNVVVNITGRFKIELTLRINPV